MFEKVTNRINNTLIKYAAIGAADSRVQSLGGKIAPVAVALAVLAPVAVIAGTAQGLPWESPMEKVKNSLTGPIALGISIIALAAAGAALVFGGELSEFTRKIIMLVMALALLVAGGSIMTTLFSASGALIR